MTNNLFQEPLKDPIKGQEAQLVGLRPCAVQILSQSLPRKLGYTCSNTSALS